MGIGEAFDAAVGYYDEWMQQALPGYAELFASAVELVPYPSDAAIEVVDLGAGTGLFTSHVAPAFPNARFVLVDVAEQLLAIAGRRFGAGEGSRVGIEIADYRTWAPPTPVDLVISSLSIHHLEHAEKRELFGRVRRYLRPGGAFINVDQVRGETKWIRELYWARWLERVRRAGADEQRILESIERRRRYDRDASLAEQLDWLREAGFTDVDAVYKNLFVAVFHARVL